jgi:hypothetical protein
VEGEWNWQLDPSGGHVVCARTSVDVRRIETSRDCEIDVEDVEDHLGHVVNKLGPDRDRFRAGQGQRKVGRVSCTAFSVNLIKKPI